LARVCTELELIVEGLGLAVEELELVNEVLSGAC